MLVDDKMYRGQSPSKKQYSNTTRPGAVTGLSSDSDYGMRGSRGTIAGAHARMGTIDEDQMDDYYQPDRETRAGGGSQMSRSYAGIENDMNAHNQSRTLLEESIAEPGRPPQHIPGLTDFLTDEYYKKFGIHTTEASELSKFWRNNVSAVQKELRAERARKKTMTFGDGFGAFSDFGMQSPSPMGGDGKNFSKIKGAAAKIGGRSVKVIPRPELPQNNFIKKYEQFSRLYELDVCMTVDNDVKEMRDIKTAQMLKASANAASKAQNTQIKEHKAKMQSIFDVYFEHKLAETLKEYYSNKPKASPPKTVKKVLSNKLNKDLDADDSYTNSNNGSNNKIGKEVDPKSKTLSDKKPAKRPQSAAGARTMDPKSQKKQGAVQSEKEFLRQIVLEEWKSPEDKKKRAGSADKQQMNKALINPKLLDMANKFRDEKWIVENVMYLIYDMKCTKMGDQRINLNQDSRSKADQKNNKDFKFTNDPKEIIQIYEQNKQRARETISGGGSLASRAIMDFFSDQNTILRLELYRHYVNKSKRKGSVPLLQFYINMLSEERLIYMVQKATSQTVEVKGKPRQNIDGEMVESSVKYQMPADHYMIQQYEEAQKQKAEDAYRKKQEINQKKINDQKKQDLASVFGPSYKPTSDDVDPLKGIQLKARDPDSIAQPKDKWKLGNELKELKKKFPHDRVLERMVEEEFKSNQVFKYPQEYDIYDTAKEEAFKAGFKNGKEATAKAWAVSSDVTFIEKQQEQIDNFKKADMYDRDGYTHMMREEAKKEIALEKFLEKQAFAYQDYVINRGKGKEKKTLRAVVAENYQAMLAAHGKVAESRFPHLAYGQDKNSETFKKSYPISYKNYFFRLVKNIIKFKTGRRAVRTKPVSLLQTVGARQSTTKDALVLKTQNTRLQRYTLGKLSHQFKMEPQAFRSRVFQRPDMAGRLKNVFMQFSEIENCKFEPETGTMNRNKVDNKEFIAGEFFLKMGVNLVSSNPRIYKQGVLKQARRWMNQGESQKSLTAMHAGFNIMRIFKKYNSTDYKAWENHKKMKDGAFTGPGLGKLRDLVDKKFHDGEKHGKGWLYRLIERWDDESTQVVKDNLGKKAVYAEDLDNEVMKPLYDEAWEVLARHVEEAREEQKALERKATNQKRLKNTYKALNEQLDDGFEETGAEIDPKHPDRTDPGELDQRKIYKTIMCPMKAECSKVKMQRWPFSGIPSKQKFGKDCPYAHHPMELQFPQTLKMRVTANANVVTTKRRPGNFKFAGDLFDCQGCGAKCNMCLYKAANLNSLKFKAKLDDERIAERKRENDTSCELFAKKFGLLKKASVLMFYGRCNDAFDEIAKAAQIIKEQWETVKENELNIQKRWQFKLNLPDGLELPKPVDKLRREDITDEFLKSIDAGNADISTIKLYIEKVCPQIRNQYDKNTFLNGLIDDLYHQTEGIMIEKQETIKKMQKNVERMAEIAELYEVLGSDAEKDPEACIDNDGNPIKMKKKKNKMCENIYQKRTHPEKELKGKKFIEVNHEAKKYRDPVTGRENCMVCPKGNKCPHAHNPMSLDLVAMSQNTKNLNGVIKSQTIKLKNAKPLEPWRPSAESFKVEDIKVQYGKKSKNNDEEDDDKKNSNKRKGILERENVFRKPYEKE